MDPYERLESINESMKRLVNRLMKNPAARADAIKIGETEHMQGHPFGDQADRKTIKQMIRHAASPPEKERLDSIHGKINQRSRPLPPFHKKASRSPTMKTSHYTGDLGRGALGFPGKKRGVTSYDTNIEIDAPIRGVKLAVGDAFKKKYGLQKESETKNETPETRKKKIFKAIDKAANTKEDPNKVAARLKAYYDKQDSGDSPFGRRILDSFNPSVNPNEKMDKEFDAAQQALTDAGISHTGLPAVGSMTREKNTIKIKKQEDMRKAREVMQDFPNTQIKRA